MDITKSPTPKITWLFACSQLIKRDLLGRYKKSVSGVLLAYLDPLMNLAVFSVIFGVFFNARFKTETGESQLTYTLAVFSGVLIYETVAEILTRSPTLINENNNLMGSFRFPLILLPTTLILSKLTQFFIAFPILVAVISLLGHPPGWSILQFPLLLLPLVLLLGGLSFLMAAIGHFFRDIILITQPLRSFFLYASAIFYNPNIVPEGFRFLVEWNPLSTIVIQTRNILFWNTGLDWPPFLFCLLTCFVIFVIGFCLFNFMKAQFSSCV